MTYHNWIVFFDADTWKKTAPMIREDGPRYFRAWVKLVPWLRWPEKRRKWILVNVGQYMLAKYVDVHWMLIPLICRYHIIICWPKYVDVHLPKLLWRSLKPYRNLSTGTIFQVFNIMYSIRNPWVNFNMSLTWIRIHIVISEMTQICVPGDDGRACCKWTDHNPFHVLGGTAPMFETTWDLQESWPLWLWFFPVVALPTMWGLLDS